MKIGGTKQDLKAPNYLAWTIDEKDFPKNGAIEKQIKFLIGYGVLAPSTHNTQPWLFEVRSNRLTILPDLHYRLPEADATGRNMCISLGACAYNIEVAANYFGLKASVQIVGHKNDASIELVFYDSRSVQGARTTKLFSAIPQRYSDKRDYSPQELSVNDWSLLKINTPDNLSLLYTDNTSTIKQIADDVLAAAASFANVPSFGQELATWLRTNNTKQGDGMTGNASGLSSGKVVVGRTLMGNVPKSMKVFAKKYYQQAVRSSGIGLISTTNDISKDWVMAGMAYEELALSVVSQNISVCPMAAMIETDYRQKLHKYFNISGQHPQVFFRLIKSNAKAIHSPRRTASAIDIGGQPAEPLNGLIGTVVTSKFTKINNYDLHYVMAGKGSPLLLIHGANMGWGQWYPNIEDLAKSYQLYAVDLPGSGQSSRFDYRKADFKKDYVDVIAKFIINQKLGPIKVIGHSFGSAIAARLALDYPELVEGLVLTSPLGLTNKVPLRQRAVSSKTFATFISKTAMKPSRKNMKAFLKSAMSNKAALTDPFIDYYHAMVSKDKRSHPLLFMHGQTRGFNFNPAMLYGKDLDKIKPPILVILGENDPLLPVQKIATIIRSHKGVKLKVFKQTGHVPAVEQSDLFNKEVLNFFKK